MHDGSTIGQERPGQGLEVRPLTRHKLLWYPEVRALFREVQVLPSSLLLLAQAPAFSGGVKDLIAQSGPIPRAVLVLLLIFSLVSWAIIIYKGMALHRAHAQSETFLQVFRKSSKFSEVNAVCGQLRGSPLVGVFLAGYLEVNQQVKGGGPGQGAAAPKPTVKSLESLSRSLSRAATVEVTRLER